MAKKRLPTDHSMEDEKKKASSPEKPKGSGSGSDKSEDFSDHDGEYENEEDDYYDDYLDGLIEEDRDRRNAAVAAPFSSSNREQSRYSTFDRIYNCYPLSYMGNSGKETGNKIIMPEDALVYLIDAQVPSPFLFEIRNMMTGKVSHCGVLEFTGMEEKSVFLPEWMMESLGLGIGETVNLRSVRLNMGTKIKLQPHTMDFLDIKEPKAVLEENLRKFCCLTAGDTVVITHERKSFYVNVVETEPENAICITDTDCEVDFSPPLDYKEPQRPLPKKVCCKEVEKPEKLNNFTRFTGSSRKLGGETAWKQVERNESATAYAIPVPKEHPVAASGRDMAAVTKFVPFTGASSRLGGEIPAAIVPSSVPKDTTSQKHKPNGGLRRGASRRENWSCNDEETEFQPLTGLSGCLDSELPAVIKSSSVTDFGGTSKVAAMQKLKRLDFEEAADLLEEIMRAER